MDVLLLLLKSIELLLLSLGGIVGLEVILAGRVFVSLDLSITLGALIISSPLLLLLVLIRLALLLSIQLSPGARGACSSAVLMSSVRRMSSKMDPDLTCQISIPTELKSS
jgi:hypothetical protein